MLLPLHSFRTYTLSVWTKSSAAGATLQIKNAGTDRSVAIPAGTAWTNVTLPGVVVTTGKAEVGVTSTGQTVKLDDFVLTRG